MTLANSEPFELVSAGRWPRLRALAWQGQTLYASRGYTLLVGTPGHQEMSWNTVGRFSPRWWRRLTCRTPLTYRLCRDGFHSLVPLSSGHLVAVVPNAIVRLAPGTDEFQVSWRIDRGTRPLNLAVTRDDQIFWGEYFDNRERAEVHVYGSRDSGKSWQVAYTFPKRTIRHIHNIVYDRWADCLWVSTGDYGTECKIIRASTDWRETEVVLSGHQQARAVAIVPTAEALYFASDTPLEANYVYRLERSGGLERLAPLDGPSFYGCRVGAALFFSTAAEPGPANPDRLVRVSGSFDGGVSWRSLVEWRKDRWSMRLFQYGAAALPAGENASGLLAATPVAVEEDDLATSMWRVPSEGGRQKAESGRQKAEGRTQEADEATAALDS